MFTGTPSEVQILGVYFPPLFVAIVAGLLCTILVTRLLNQSGLSRFFWHPPLAMLGLTALMSALIGLFVLAP